MYAEGVVTAKLDAAKRFLGWTPDYHSVDEVDRFNAHMRHLETLQPNGDVVLSREPNRKESAWMRNERAICYADERYFSTRYAMISDEENHLVHYAPRASQRIFHNILKIFDEKQLSIEIQALKARQQGISTEVELKFCHRVVFVPGSKAIAASADAQKSELMASMFYTVLDNLPWWMRPQYRKNRRSGQRGLIEFYTSSIVAIQSGGQDTGLGQGWTPTLAHISEVCDYSNPVELVDEGLFKAMHTSPVLFLILESTGNGNVGWWADTWRTSKEFYPQGRARLFPLFLPWHLCSDMFPRKSWLEKFPIPGSWRPAKETLNHAAKCKAFVRQTDYLVKELGREWELPRDQMWFWEFNYEESKRKHAAKSWLRQMPCDDFEALQGKNDSVFGQETIEVVEEEREKNIRVYGIVGEGIEEKHEPPTHEVNYHAERFTVSFNSPRGSTFDWMFIPLLPISDLDEYTAMGKLLVFEDPIPGWDYSIGVDCAGGIGEDRTVIAVVRKGIDEGQDVQAAEFTSGLVSAAEAAPFCAALAAWVGEGIPNHHQPKFAVEQVRKYGDDCQRELKKLGFYRHHNMIHYDRKKIEEHKANKQGWFTVTWSRPLLLDRFVASIEGGWFKVNSPFLIKEMSTFEQRYTSSGLARMEHQQDKHDDRIFANAMAYFTSHHLDAMLERSQKRYNAPRNKFPEVNREPYVPYQFKVSLPGERIGG